MSIAENLALAARRGSRAAWAGRCAASRAEDLRDRVRHLNMGLEDRLDNRHRQPLGRPAAGADAADGHLAASPQLLLLDEHTAALDPQERRSGHPPQRADVIARDRLTTLMVTHSMQQAVNLGDRLIMMHRGRVIHDFRAPRSSACAPTTCWRASRTSAAASSSTRAPPRCCAKATYRVAPLPATTIRRPSTALRLCRAEWAPGPNRPLRPRRTTCPAPRRRRPSAPMTDLCPPRVAVRFMWVYGHALGPSACAADARWLGGSCARIASEPRR